MYRPFLGDLLDESKMAEVPEMPRADFRAREICREAWHDGCRRTQMAWAVAAELGDRARKVAAQLHRDQVQHRAA